MVLLEFSKIKGYHNFIQWSHLVLVHTLEEFFSAEVKLEFNPIAQFKRNGICDIENNPYRNVYIVPSDSVILVCNVKSADSCYMLGISLTAKKIGETNNGKIYNIVAIAISEALRIASISCFRKSIELFGENLIVSTIAKYASPTFNPSKIRYLLRYFNALRSTTFEGKYFSTGLILTISLFDYKKNADKGDVMYLTAAKIFSDNIDSRYWYLVDGHSSYYLSDAKKEIHYMFINKSTNQNYIDQVLLSNSLHHRDILFRTDNGRELSVITSDGIEFIYQENVWRYRNFHWLKKIIMEEVNLSEDVYNTLLYYVLYCSKNETSSIIWIPKNEAKISEYLKSSHSVSRKLFKIFDSQFDGLIKRLLASDGATVICKDGTVKYYGCIIDMDAKQTKALKGTGETAASKLASNGIAIKISQDGTIKIFLNNNYKIIKF